MLGPFSSVSAPLSRLAASPRPPIVGRIVAGIGMGCITSNVPIWQAEISPTSIRGAIVCSALSFSLLGQVSDSRFGAWGIRSRELRHILQLIAYWSECGTSMYNSSFSWRFPFSLQAVLAIIVSTLLFFMPESPRWPFSHDRDEEAVQVLAALRGSSGEGSLAETEAEEIRAAIMLENSVQRGWSGIFKEDKVGSRWRLPLAIGLQSMQPFSGSAAISYY